MIYVEKHAQKRIYRLNSEIINKLSDWTEMMRQLWKRRLDTMDAVLKEELNEQKRKGANEDNK